ncbi:MAG: cation:proton antiporter [Deltaproteobacteria bacterium]|nr:cation:proton antiporter [Deltaproteobacteria bacterium]
MLDSLLTNFFVEGGVFFEMAVILGLAAAMGLLGQKLRQPLIVMFLAAGILSGPAVLGIIESYEQIELLAHMGIAFLLFIVGLRLDLNLIRTTGPVALATGLGQIIFTSVIGFGIALLFGLPFMSAAYVSVALTFSSTIIIVKLLSDKKEIDSLHGQIAVGFLIVQDIAAILALVLLTTLGSRIGAEESVWLVSSIIAFKGIGFLTAVWFMTAYLIPGLLKRLADSQELLVLFAVAWAILLGGVAELLGFSKEVGAFLAGVSLASSNYRDMIAGRLTSLRDFLLLFFFIDLGARLNWQAVGSQINASIWFSLFVLLGNPLIVLVIMGLMGYRRRTSFLAGLTVAQISEFSLIVAALGLSLGHITQQDMGLITLVGVVTICVSTYMILYSAQLYRFLERPLKLFERQNPHREPLMDISETMACVDVIVMGLGGYGSGIAAQLMARKKTFIGVDFDPAALERWRSQGVFCIYGDMADPEILEQLPLTKTRWVVSTVRSKELSMALMNLLKHKRFNGKVALTAINEMEADLYQKTGAQVVFRPFSDAAEQAADALTDAMDILPDDRDLPISFREIRINPGSIFAGQTVRNIPLRSETNVSILAVSRRGAVSYSPDPDFQIFPGDRLIIVGLPTELKEAETLLNRQEVPPDEANALDQFNIDEIRLAPDSPLDGKTLAEAQFRQKYDVMVVGIRRAEEQILKTGPAQRLQADDHLLVIGSSKNVAALKRQEPL